MTVGIPLHMRQLLHGLKLSLPLAIGRLLLREIVNPFSNGAATPAVGIEYPFSNGVAARSTGIEYPFNNGAAAHSIGIEYSFSNGVAAPGVELSVPLAMGRPLQH